MFTLLKSLILMLMLLGFTFAQNIEIEKTDKSREKATEILTNSSNAIGLRRKVAEIKALSVNIESSIRESSNISGEKVDTQSDSKIDINYVQPSKIKIKNESNTNSIFRGSQNSNQSVRESILNDSLYSNKSTAFVDGKQVNLPLKPIPKDIGIANLKQSLFQRTFQITLDSSWYMPLDFYYVGIAESKDGRANIIESTSSNKTVYRFFFDEKTNLLLMMIKTAINKENKPVERKYFYSEYQEKDGLLVATKIKVEEDGNFFEEVEIKSLKINPTFKPNFF